MFHEDVVQVVRKRLEQEEDLPEEQRPTALARSYYLKVPYYQKSSAPIIENCLSTYWLFWDMSVRNCNRKLCKNF